MKFAGSDSLNGGQAIFEARGLLDWSRDIFNTDLELNPRSTTAIRDHVQAELEEKGWGFRIKIDPSVDLTIFAKRNDLAFQLQTGNISRYAYDALKIQHLFTTNQIEAAILAVPTKSAARSMGSNIAHADRIVKELEIFRATITVPILLIAFE